MSKKQVNVKFRVTSYEGDSEFEMPSSQAFLEIKKLAEEQNKWIYINGEVQNKELLTEDDLIKATEEDAQIILMNALAGGNYKKIVDIDFKVSKKNKKPITIDFEENKYAKIFKIVIAKDNISDILRNRDTLIRVLKKKLNDLVEEQTKKFEETIEEEREEFEEDLDLLREEFDEEETKKIDEFEELIDTELNKYF